MEEQRRVGIFGSDHTYGRTIVQPVQQQKELQPIEVVVLEDSLTVMKFENMKLLNYNLICLLSKSLSKSQEDDLIPLARATDTRSMTPPIRAPYDLTGRMVEEPEKTIPVNRISASKPAITLPTPATSSNQELVPVTYGQTEIQPYIAQQQKEIQAVLQKFGGSVTVMKLNFKLTNYCITVICLFSK